MKAATTLSIETAIQGGSLALFRGDREVDSRVGSRDVSKAEDVLEQISLMLTRQALERVDLIVVSEGPGSLTGTRIGFSTALGLRKSWNCRVVGISLFDAFALGDDFREATVIAIPFGGTQICWQIFDKDRRENAREGAARMPERVSAPIFFENINKNMSDYGKIKLHKNLKNGINDIEEKIRSGKVELLADNYAKLIGLSGIKKSKHLSQDLIFI